jgi:hypothetical protein
MSESEPAPAAATATVEQPKRRRWKRWVILSLCLLLLAGGIWRWNHWRQIRPFIGQWRMVGPYPGVPTTVFQSDGRVQHLPWRTAEYFTTNHNTLWTVSSGDLIVQPYTAPPPITDFFKFIRYWENRFGWADLHHERLEIIEVSDERIRLRLKEEGAPETVYERVDNSKP